MSRKISRTGTAEYKHSRAALLTIEMAVAATEGAIKRLSTLQGHLFRAHRDALGTFQIARHHSLKGPDLRHVEERVGDLADRLVGQKGSQHEPHTIILSVPSLTPKAGKSGAGRIRPLRSRPAYST